MCAYKYHSSDVFDHKIKKIPLKVTYYTTVPSVYQPAQWTVANVVVDTPTCDVKKG